MALVVKNPTANARYVRDGGSIPGSGQFLQEGMAIHSRILARKIPWTEKPGRGYSPWGRKESDMTEAGENAQPARIYDHLTSGR